MHGVVVRIGLVTSEVENRIKVLECIVERPVDEPGLNNDRLPRWNLALEMCRGLRTDLRGVDALGPAVHDCLVKSILHVGSRIADIEKALKVRLVLGEQ